MFLQSLIDSLDNRLNMIFIVIIGCLFVAGLFLALIKKLQNFRSFIPSLCSSVGVFGTFLGIFVGLSAFDTTKISESIPPLLEGMKTAFVTSLAGMLASLLLKSFYNIIDDKNETIYDDTSLLQGINDSSKNINLACETMTDKIVEMNKTIVDFFSSREHEASLVNQVTLIRSEIRDNHEKTQAILREMLDSFANMVSKNLVGELSTVVEKFNTMLNELVAESFKKLTESTNNLNQWQSSYKEQILKNEQFLSETISALDSVKNTFSEIGSHMSSIDQSLSSINLSGNEFVHIADSLHQQSEQFESMIEQIVKAGEAAKQVIPKINEKMNGILDSLGEMNAKTNQFVDDTVQKISSSTDLLNVASKDLTAVVENSTKSIEELVAEHIKSTQTGLQETLTRSLTTFASSLAELSSKFAKDYTPLTERLRTILEISERAAHR